MARARRARCSTSTSSSAGAKEGFEVTRRSDSRGAGVARSRWGCHAADWPRTAHGELRRPDHAVRDHDAPDGACLADFGIDGEQLYVSTERNMQCGIASLRTLPLGPWLLCRDGPVFDWQTLAHWLQT